MRILHMTWALCVGGAEEMLVDILNEQSQTHQVSLMVVNERIDEQLAARINPSVDVIRLRRKPGSFDPFPLIRLNRLVSRLKPNILHAHSPSFVKILLQQKAKSVLTVHTTMDAERFDSSILRYHKVFAISEAVAEEIRKREDRVRPAVVLNGVPLQEIRLAQKPRTDVFRLIQVARLEHLIKGQDILLRAVSRLRDCAGFENVQLDLVGEGNSKAYLKGLVQELGLQESVKFRGSLPRSTIYSELCNYDLLVQPSRYEGFGLAVVEAMAAGVPVLVSDLEGPREIVEGGRFGFSFSPGDETDCARQIQSIRNLQNTPALNSVLQAAREHVVNRFDVQRTAHDYLLEYQELLDCKPQNSAVEERDLPISSTVRNWLGGAVALALITSGRVRWARERALNDGVVTPIYMHNPNKRLFTQCVQWLIDNGFTFISSDELINILHRGVKPPKGAVWLSIDDGFRRNLDSVVPVIREHKIPITIFIPSGIVKGNGLFPWLNPDMPPDGNGDTLLQGRTRNAMTVADLKELARYPEITIGSHTVNHSVTRGLSDEQLRFEVEESKRTLESWIGRTVNTFSYPVGEFDGRERRMLAASGYMLAATTQARFIKPENDPYLLPRFCVGDEILLPEAICNMVGVWRRFVSPAIRACHYCVESVNLLGKASSRTSSGHQLSQ